MERTSNKNTDENILLEEGILLRVKFRNDGIATLYRKDDTDRKKNGERNSGLMLEGIPVWVLFRSEGRNALYAQEQMRFTEDGYVPGRLLSPDISPLHEVYDWDSQYAWIHSKFKIWIRYRIRLRFPRN